MRKQAGFTLIELVMVIVILGILAATALPRFVDLSGEAEAAAIQGVQGGLASQSAINYASCSALRHVAGARCATVDNCDDIPGIMTGWDPSFTVAAGTADTTNGNAIACTVTRDWNGDLDTADANESLAWNAIAAGNP